jgi:hypothetical protein
MLVTMAGGPSEWNLEFFSVTVIHASRLLRRWLVKTPADGLCGVGNAASRCTGSNCATEEYHEDLGLPVSM